MTTQFFAIQLNFFLEDFASFSHEVPPSLKEVLLDLGLVSQLFGAVSPLISAQGFAATKQKMQGSVPQLVTHAQESSMGSYLAGVGKNFFWAGLGQVFGPRVVPAAEKVETMDTFVLAKQEVVSFLAK